MSYAKSDISYTMYDTISHNNTYSPTSQPAYLTGALSLGYYTLPKNRSMMVIGEQHSLNVARCSKTPRMHVADYVKRRMRNDDTLLLMEYPPEKQIHEIKYTSANMREIRDVAVSLNMENRTIGIDTRRSHIDSDVLYGSRVYDMTYREFLKRMWEPLTNDNVFALPSKYLYDDDDYAFLVKYVESKRGNARWFYHKIIPILNLDERIGEHPVKIRDHNVGDHTITIVEFMRKIWADISDKRILEIVLQRHSSKTYIIVVGFQHAKNIRRIFAHFETSYSQPDVHGCIRV